MSNIPLKIDKEEMDKKNPLALKWQILLLYNFNLSFQLVYSTHCWTEKLLLKLYMQINIHVTAWVHISVSARFSYYLSLYGVFIF